MPGLFLKKIFFINEDALLKKSLADGFVNTQAI
jgi:hypothetical protein